MLIIYLLYLFLGICALSHGLACGGLLHFSRAVELWLELAYGFWFAITMALFQVVIGRRIMSLSWFRCCRPSGATAALVSFTIGSYVSYCVLFAGAITGVYSVPGLLVYVLVAAVLAVAEFVRHQRDIACLLLFIRRATSLPYFPEASTDSCAVLCLLWMLSPYLGQVFMPNTDWDGVMYHLPIAKRLLDSGILVTEPYSHHYNFPGAIHLFYGLFIALGAESAIVPFNFLFALATIMALGVMCHRTWGTETAIWSVSICITSNLIWRVAMTPRIDVQLAFYFLMACYSLFLWDENRKQTGYLAIVGMALGMALGIKYTGAVYAAVALCALGGLAAAKRDDSRSYPSAAMAYLVVALLVPSAFWYARNWISLGDPVYPLAAKRLVYVDNAGKSRDFGDRLAPFLERSVPSLDELDDVLKASVFGRVARFAPVRPKFKNQLRLWDVVMNPRSYARQDHETLSPLVLLFFAVPLVRHDKTALLLFALGLGSFIPIAAMSRISRYIIPSIPLLAIGAAVVLKSLLDWLGHRHKRIAALAKLALIVFVFWVFSTNLIHECETINSKAPIDYIYARESKIDYLSRVGYNGVTSAPAASRFINARLAAERHTSSGVVMIGEAKGYLLDGPYIPDHMVFEGHRWLAELLNADGNYGKLADRLLLWNYRYMIIDSGHIQWSLSEGPQSTSRTRQIQGAAFHAARFLERYARLVYRDDTRGYYIAEIQPGRQGRRTPRPDRID